MFRPLFEAFAGDCVRRIATGQLLAPAELHAFSLYLEAKELTGHCFLGPYAGPDAPFDTVTGRCGHPVVKVR